MQVAKVLAVVYQLVMAKQQTCCHPFNIDYHSSKVLNICDMLQTALTVRWLKAVISMTILLKITSDMHSLVSI